MLPAAALLALLAAASAEVAPPRAHPGDAVLVTVRDAPAPPQGTLLGRALRFWEAGPGTWRALAPLPTEAPAGPAALTLTAAGEPVAVVAALEILPAAFRTTTLDVPPRFLDPPAWAKKAMARDQEALGKAYAQPFGPPGFAAPFALPADHERTGRYGDQRVYNGGVAGAHYGLDLAGPAGAPVAASNDGVVVLARECYQSGRTVILWHGAGLFTAYLHLSKMEVKPGEHVRKGARVGRIGSTGRSTGPHLHWGAKVDGLWVDPESLMRIEFGTATATPTATPIPTPAPAASP
jgi:murein DD-endopeptidase MepM/ murein hydrolase activator NlpD